MSAAKKPKHRRIPPHVTVNAAGVETYRFYSVALCGVRITPSITANVPADVTCPACRERIGGAS